jgi:hypothetical protein
MSDANWRRMRTWLVVAMLAGSVTTAAAGDLDANAIHAELKPFAGAIERCYIDRTTAIYGAGHVELVLDISRYGVVEHVDVTTPGLPAKLAKDVGGCIRAAIAPVSFPAQPTTTTATVPYFFQRTAAPNAGPQLSCWNPRGCHAAKAGPGAKVAASPTTRGHHG